MGGTDEDRGQRIRHGRCAPTQRERLIKPLVQERNGPLPGKLSSLGVILGAILLEEPMARSWIRREGDLPPRGAESFLKLTDLLDWFFIVMLGKMTQNVGLSL